MTALCLYLPSFRLPNSLKGERGDYYQPRQGCVRGKYVTYDKLTELTNGIEFEGAPIEGGY